MTLDDVRTAEYPDIGDGIFFNAASYGLLPRRAAAAASDLTRRRNRPGGFREEELGEALRRCRTALGLLLAVDPGSVTLAPNTSYGVNLGAELAATREPGTIVLSEGEFPANVYPWRALRDRGFSVEVVPADERGRPDPDRLLERLEGADVRAFALSTVQFATGYMADLEMFGRVCRERDVLFVVDAIQALGTVPVRPSEAGIDLLASGGQKWLCSPWGSGLVWIDPRHRAAFDPPMVSWLSMEGALDFTGGLGYEGEYLDDGRKFELATLGVQDYLALAHSVELFLEVGVERIRSHIFQVQRPLLDWIEGRDDVRLVTPADPARRAGIVSFSPPDPHGVAASLTERGVSLAVREGAIRLSPHFYNTVDEMEETVEMLDRAL